MNIIDQDRRALNHKAFSVQVESDLEYQQDEIRVHAITAKSIVVSGEFLQENLVDDRDQDYSNAMDHEGPFDLP